MSGWRRSSIHRHSRTPPPPRGPMTLPVSTSGSKEFGLSGLVELDGVAVWAGVVGGWVGPASPDDADPRPCQDPDGVWVVHAAATGRGVDVGCPVAVVAAVVGERGDGYPE